MSGLDALAEEARSRCPFCVIAHLDPHDQVIRRYHRTVVFEPLEPVVPGHLLIVPVMHVADAAVNSSVTAETSGVASLEAARLEGPFNLITSAGRAATQTVFHLHVHLVPREPGDGLHLPWTER